MPQTSPIHWTMLSLLMVTSILYISSSISEKTHQSMTKQTKFTLMMKSWNW